MARTPLRRVPASMPKPWRSFVPSRRRPDLPRSVHFQGGNSKPDDQYQARLVNISVGRSPSGEQSERRRELGMNTQSSSVALLLDSWRPPTLMCISLPHFGFLSLPLRRITEPETAIETSSILGSYGFHAATAVG